MAAHREAPLKGVLVASPANPTGTMMGEEALAALIATATDAGIKFISDEIYHGLDYAFPAQTAAALSDDVVVINSFSKYFCMTGWRIGWMVAPEALVRPIERLHQNLAISVPTISQIAAEAAFEGAAEMELVKARLCAQPPPADRRNCPVAASTPSCPPTAPSISMRTCRASRTTPTNSPSGCSPRPMWRSRPGSISTPSTARNSYACPMRERRPTWRSRSRGCGTS